MPRSNNRHPRFAFLETAASLFDHFHSHTLFPYFTTLKHTHSNWSKMIKARSVAGMPSARQALLEQLRYIYHSRRWKVVVAYDEHTPGSELRVMEGDVDEVYTGALDSADSYIERRAVELCKKTGGPRVKVATDDRTIQVVTLASGAEMISTSSLIKEIYLARRELLFQRDNSDWRTKKAFDDAQEYFID